MGEPSLHDLAFGEQEPANALELKRNLLSAQLDDLDGFVERARVGDRTLEQKLGRQDFTEEMPAAPGLENLLRAQLREVQSWLEETRRRPRPSGEAAFRAPLAEERVLSAINRARLNTVEAPHKSMENPALKGQRLQAAKVAAEKLLDAETQSRLALEKASGTVSRSTEELGRLCSQVKALETDPAGRWELARYAPSDIALAFVGAIDQRRALVNVLSDALSSYESLSSSVQVYDQLLACHRSSALLSSGSLPAASAAAAPAAQIVFASLTGSAEASLPAEHANRLEALARRNAELWQQYREQELGVSSGYSNTRSAPLILPGDGSGAGMQNTSLSSSSGNRRALHSQLDQLRSQEGRLDALLMGGGRSGGSPRSPGSPGQTHNFSMATTQKPQRAGNALQTSLTTQPLAGGVAVVPRYRGGGGPSQLQAPGDTQETSLFNEPTTSFMGGFTLRSLFEGWSNAAHSSRLARKSRREAVVNEIMSHVSAPLAFVSLFSALTTPEPRQVPPELARGEVVQEIASGRTGLFASISAKGVCKVTYDDGESFTLVNTAAIKWLHMGPHTFYGGLLFHAWAYAYRVARKQGILRFRMAVQRRDFGRTSVSLLAWLAAVCHDDAMLKRLAFQAWQQVLGATIRRYHAILQECWAAWRQAVLIFRHGRAVQEMQQTSAELHDARLAVLRQTKRNERSKHLVVEMIKMQEQLWASWVLNAWQGAAQLIRIRKGLDEAAREERGQVTEILTEKMVLKSTQHTMLFVLKAWHDTVSRRRQVFKVFITRKLASEEMLKTAVFASWKSVRYVILEGRYMAEEMHSQELRGELMARREEMMHLQELSQDMYGYASDSTSKVKQLEHALEAAQRAMTLTTEHSERLSQQVQVMEQTIHYEEMVPNQLRSELAAELHQDSVLRAEVNAVDFDRRRLWQECVEANQEARTQQALAQAAERKADEALYDSQQLLSQLHQMGQSGGATGAALRTAIGAPQQDYYGTAAAPSGAAAPKAGGVAKAKARASLTSSSILTETSSEDDSEGTSDETPSGETSDSDSSPFSDSEETSEFSSSAAASLPSALTPVPKASAKATPKATAKGLPKASAKTATKAKAKR